MAGHPVQRDADGVNPHAGGIGIGDRAQLRSPCPDADASAARRGFGKGESPQRRGVRSWFEVHPHLVVARSPGRKQITGENRECDDSRGGVDSNFARCLGRCLSVRLQSHDFEQHAVSPSGGRKPRRVGERVTGSEDGRGTHREAADFVERGSEHNRHRFGGRRGWCRRDQFDVRPCTTRDEGDRQDCCPGGEPAEPDTGTARRR